MKKIFFIILILPHLLFAKSDPLSNYISGGKFQSDALLIIKNNKIIFEHYNSPFNQSKKHLLWSVSKSILQILVGIAIDERRVSLSDSLCNYFTNIDTRKCNIRVKHLLEWTSGLNWSETYENSIKESSVIAMLYTENKSGVTPFILSHPVISNPGTRWYYSSGDTNLLSAVLSKVYYDKPLYPFDLLFKPMGITNVTFETDRKGVYIGSSYLYMTARDLAKIGLLFLNNGQYENQQIVSNEWIKFSTQIVSAFKENPERQDINDIPGHHWWLNQEIREKNIPKPWPALSSKTIAARGHWGQLLIIDPTQSMVIVRFGNDRNQSIDLNHFTRSVVKFAREIK